MKKVAVIGRGTAGCLSVGSLMLDKSAFAPDVDFFNYEVDWYYDSNTKAQPVGEGTTLAFSNWWRDKINYFYEDTDRIEMVPKFGIQYDNWGKSDYLHSFPTGDFGFHMNAVEMQDYMFNRFQVKKIDNVIEDPHDVDADMVIDCRGRPKDLKGYYAPKYIPVNTALIHQCPWDGPKFFHTKTIARPYGWVFMIPLRNRCSVGYMFNKHFNDPTDILSDLQDVFKDYNLTPDKSTCNKIAFQNYYKKEIIEGRVRYNGNKAFFLEPMEATSLDTMFEINNASNSEQVHQYIRDNEFIIMIHYAAGSKWDTPFWKYAQERGKECMDEYHLDPRVFRTLTGLNNNDRIGAWHSMNLYYNLKGLGLEDYN